MTGPAIKYYRVLVPTKDGLEKLNELGAAGHILCHLERRQDGNVSLIMAMPRSWDDDPWVPSEVRSQLLELRRMIEDTVAESRATHVAPVERLRDWIEKIDEIMNPEPDKATEEPE